MKWFLFVLIFLMGCTQTMPLSIEEMINKVRLCESAGLTPIVVYYSGSGKVAYVRCNIPENYKIGDITNQLQEASNDPSRD